jgi:transcription initiation factor TFIIIB Brf1 subunit/transcription initiation factor TFIIB
MNESYCLICKRRLTRHNDGNIVCENCGLVHNEMFLSDIPEWDLTNTYSIDEVQNPYITLSTFTQKGSKSLITINGKICNNDIYNLHVQNSYTNKQRSFDKIESIIDNHLGNYSASILNTTKQLWHLIMESGHVTRGPPRLGLLACCLYYSCIFYGTSRTHKEICKDFGLENKIFNKSHKTFVSLFQQNKDWSFLLYKNISIKDYLLRFCSDIEIAGFITEYYKLYNECIDYYELKKDTLKNAMITNPKNISCAILCIICKEITKKYITNNMDVSYPTLNKIINILDAV